MIVVERTVAFPCLVREIDRVAEPSRLERKNDQSLDYLFSL